jgi:Xaa-Pro aminopeptidase
MDSDINPLKFIKNPEEISKIEKACKLGDKTFNYILKKIHLGISEKEVAQEIDSFMESAGGKPSFPTIVAFGKNSANIHNVPTDNKLMKNQIILLDLGVKLDDYCSDMTRTVFSGHPTPKQKKIYQTVLEAQNKSFEILNTKYLIRNTIPAKDVDGAARDYIISKGYPTIPHSVGHGIGIDVHEFPHISPKSNDILKEGMVFSIEPGIYLPASPQGGPNFGGVRIEDLVVLEKSGARLLTHSPRRIIEL